MQKKIITLHLLLSASVACFSQNVGIGTNTPLKKLSVNGSLLIDQENNNTGSADSAAIRFGTNSVIGFSSNQDIGGVNPFGLDFWTNGVNRMNISSTGNVGINTVNPIYRLDVNGSARTSSLQTGNILATGNIGSDSDVIANDDLFAADDLQVIDDANIGGNVGVGATPSASYKLNVNGNVLVQTNLGVDGTARIDGKLINEGKGMVLSNSTTTLKTGFSSGTFSVSLPPFAFIDISFCITNFTGNNSNVRVSIGQFTPGTGATNWGQVIYTPHTVSASNVACGGGSSVQVRLQNVGSTTANLGTNAVLYLSSTVTN